MVDNRSRSWFDYFKGGDETEEPVRIEFDQDRDQDHPEVEALGPVSEDDERTVRAEDYADVPDLEDAVSAKESEESEESEEEATEEEESDSDSSDSDSDVGSSDSDDFDTRRKWKDLESRLSNLEDIFALISRAYLQQKERKPVYR
jgi:hypothetical protein